MPQFTAPPLERIRAPLPVGTTDDSASGPETHDHHGRVLPGDYATTRDHLTDHLGTTANASEPAVPDTTEASFDFGEPLSPMSPSGSVTGYLRQCNRLSQAVQQAISSQPLVKPPAPPKSPYLNQIGPRARIGSPRSGFRNGVSSAKGSNASSLAGSKPDSNSNSLKPQLSQGHQGQGLLTTHSSHTSAKGSRASSLAGSKPDLNSNSNPRPSSSREVSGTGALSMDPAPPPVPRSATSSPRVSTAEKLEEEAAAARVDKEEAGAAGDGDATEQHLYTEAEAEDVEEDIVTEAKA
eukprot:gene31090-6219_t